MSTGQSSQPAGPNALKVTAIEPAGSARGAGTSGELAAFFVELLEYQCRLVGGVAGAVILGASGARRGGIAGVFSGPAPWASAGDAVRAEDLGTDAMRRRIERLGGEVIAGASGTTPQKPPVEELAIGNRALYEVRPTHRLIASPLAANGNVEGASVILIPIGGGIGAAEAMARLGASAARFEAFLWRAQCMGEGAQVARLRETLELLDAAQQGADSATMGSILCHELRRRFGCTRVSIGLIRGDAVRLIAVSGTDVLDRRGPAVESIESAMEECAAQDVEVIFPAPAESESDPAQRRVTRAHEELSRKFGPAALLSLPLRVSGDLAGVMLLEREASDPFPPGSAGLMRLVAEFVGPAVYTRRLADRGVLAVVRDRVMEFGEGVVGPRHTGAKLLLLFVVIVLILMSVVPVPDRVTAGAEVKATLARAVVPPFTGYLSSAKVKAGDEVRRGDELAAMDASDLELQLARLRAEESTLSTQRDESQGRGELAKARSYAAQIDEVRANIAMTQDKLERSTIRAPIDGVVSRGDLEPLIGARVDPTQPLMEIAGTERTVVVRIVERDVHRVADRLLADGKVTGWLSPRALPGERVPIVIERLNPGATVTDSGNVFLAEASVDTSGGPAPGWLRPGMTGTAKLNEGVTTVMSRLVRPLTDELRLRAWWW